MMNPIFIRKFFDKSYLKHILQFSKVLNASNQQIQNIHSTMKFKTHKDGDLLPSKKEIAAREQLFREIKSKDKDTFLKVIENFSSPDKVKRGHVEFIYTALKCMEDYGVQGDLETYKKLMDVFPKGRYIPKSLLQAEFYHFPRHQDCGILLLDQMEYHGICPDREMVELVFSIFGKSSHVYKKLCRMLYWMPKLKNLNPYKLPEPIPSDIRDLARFALKKMSVDIRTKIVEYDAENLDESEDKTWIMSAQSPVQQKLIEEHSEEKSLFIEGPSLVWLGKISLTYFVLRADPKIYPEVEFDDDDVSNLSNFMFGDPIPKELTLTPGSVHEQEDGIVLAMCCTGTSSKDSLLSWIRFLQISNPKLGNIPVLFKIKSSPSSLVSINADKENIGKEEETADKNVQ